MFRTGIALFAVVMLAALPADARAQAKKSGDVVKVKATASEIKDNKQTVTLTITIDKPWHLYANPVGQMDLAEAMTVVTITGKEKPQSVKITYPAGKEEKDDVVGNYMIYVGEIVITAEVVRAKGDTEPLKAKIKVNACRTEGKSGTCLPGSDVEVEIK